MEGEDISGSNHFERKVAVAGQGIFLGRAGRVVRSRPARPSFSLGNTAMGKSNFARRGITLALASAVQNSRPHGGKHKSWPPRVAPQMRHGAKATTFKNDRATSLTIQEHAR
jgi:hypothetical protein